MEKKEISDLLDNLQSGIQSMRAKVEAMEEVKSVESIVIKDESPSNSRVLSDINSSMR